MQNHHLILLDQTKSAEVRIQAAFQLLVDHSQKALESLIVGLLTDPSPIVRHECAFCIGEFSSDIGPEALVKSMNNDENKFVVHEATLAVSTAGYEKSRIHIERLLLSKDKDIVDTAEIALQRLDGLCRELDDPSEVILNLDCTKETRIQAAFKLLKENSETAVRKLIDAMKQETSPIVKHEIIFALGETASTRAVDSLISELDKDDNDFVVHEILLSLGSLGNDKARLIVEQYTRSTIPEISESAEIALQRLVY